MNLIVHALSASGTAGSTVMPEAGSGDTASVFPPPFPCPSFPDCVTFSTTLSAPSAEKTRSTVLELPSFAAMEILTDADPFPLITEGTHQSCPSDWLILQLVFEVTDTILSPPVLSTVNSVEPSLSSPISGVHAAAARMTAARKCRILFIMSSCFKIGNQRPDQRPLIL